MLNLLDDEGFFKAKAPRKTPLFKVFCTHCDADFYSQNPTRKLCLVCSKRAAAQEALA